MSIPFEKIFFYFWDWHSIFFVLYYIQEVIPLAYDTNSRITQLRKHLNLSQTSFGERLGISRGVIKNIDEHNAPAKPLLIQQICKEYNVNREWLETGEGEMFNPIDRDVELAGYVAEILTEDNGSIRKRIIETMRRADKTLSAEHWEALSRLFTIWAEVNRDFDSEEKEEDGQ